MAVFVPEALAEPVDQGKQQQPRLPQVEGIVGLREASQVTLNRLDGIPEIGRDLLRLLVVLEDARQQKADDEHGAADATGQQAVEIQELESEVVDRDLRRAQKQHDDAHSEEQPELLPEGDIRATEMKMRDYR
ncbi:hypothetical protein ACQ86E_31365 [Bradyrhizobium betae]|uniref:hypothetical protein n=1 Tax=Bradyrhizobium betae TaxID=244734 RepID=UPI003D66EE3E